MKRNHSGEKRGEEKYIFTYSEKHTIDFIYGKESYYKISDQTLKNWIQGPGHQATKSKALDPV